jgi:hypothetical protein
MPKRCGAYLLAADHPTYERLAATVLALGFEHCLPFVSAREVARGRDFPLNYLFVHDGVDLATMAATFVDVRWYEDKDIRFMPVVLLAEHTTRAESRELWKLGYDVMLDDLGETQDNAAQLMLQITEPQHYYETEDYFGPNRRISRDPDQDVAASFCRHMLIRRSPVYGVRVASSEVLERAQLYAY